MKTKIVILLTAITIMIACEQLDLSRIMMVKTIEVTDITTQSANVKGKLIDLGEGMNDYGVFYSTSPNAQNGTKYSMGTPDGTGEYTAILENLDWDTQYYTRTYGTDGNEYTYGDEVSFNTKSKTKAEIGLVVTGVVANSAKIRIEIKSLGYEVDSITDYGLILDSISTFSDNSMKISWGTSTQTIVVDTILTGLKAGTEYYIKAYAESVVGKVESEVATFTISNGIPQLTTTAITNITATTATSGGNITNDGGFVIIERGVCYSTSSSPTITDSYTTDGTGIGSFVSELTELTPNVKYYLRAYATNSVGTVYGNEQTFTTTDGLPQLTTTAITSITATTATSGGNITDDGGFAITKRGVCYSTSVNPTVSDSHTIDGTGVGSFVSELVELTPNVKYYVRAYATNSVGTVYSDEVTFFTGCKDYDGNIYEIVTIGSQVWMAENLKVTHYPNGSVIPHVTDNTTWKNLGDNNIDDAFCFYNNDASLGYGALYSYAAAIADNWTKDNAQYQGVCPDGWHLPSDDEWTELENYISADGHSGAEGTALKSISGWNDDGNGTDDYGFSAFPGGFRSDVNGTFYLVGSNGEWWSCTEGGSYSTYTRDLRNNYLGVYRYHYPMSSGYSVRCVKNSK